MRYINLTPRWSELFSTWKMIVEDAVKVKKPDQMLRFWSEVRKAFEYTDKYNFLQRGLIAYKQMTPEEIAALIEIGEDLFEKDRNTVREDAA